jgi:hypothetical protein
VVEIGLAADFLLGHEDGEVAGLGGLPGDVVEAKVIRTPRDFAGETVRRRMGVFTKVEEDGEIGYKLPGPIADVDHGFVVAAMVLLALDAQSFAGLRDLVTVMEELNGLLDGDGDEQANYDGGDVEEEVAPGVGGVVGRVDLEQGETPGKWGLWGHLIVHVRRRVPERAAFSE